MNYTVRRTVVSIEYGSRHIMARLIAACMAIDVSIQIGILAHFIEYLVEFFLGGLNGNTSVFITTHEIFKLQRFEYVFMKTFICTGFVCPFLCVDHYVISIKGVYGLSRTYTGIAPKFAVQDIINRRNMIFTGAKIIV